MSASELFKKFAGKSVTVGQTGRTYYVPGADEAEEMLGEAVEGLHPQGALEAGFACVAVEGALEDGEMVQMDGFVAVNDETDKAYACDEGTISHFDVAASKLTLRVKEEDSDD